MVLVIGGAVPIPMCAVGSTLRKAVPQPEMGLPSGLTFRPRSRKNTLWVRKGQWCHLQTQSAQGVDTPTPDSLEAWCKASA